MSLPLSPDTEAVVKVLFKPEDYAMAVRLLVDSCGNNLPNEENSDEYALEDLRLTVLYMSKGNLSALRGAIMIAQEDFRELKGTNTKAFVREVLGDVEGAQRVRRLTSLCLALIGAGAATGFGMGLTAVSYLWLVLPAAWIAGLMEVLYRNSQNRPLRGSPPIAGIPRWAALLVLVVFGRLWGGVAISGASYFIGHLIAVA